MWRGQQRDARVEFGGRQHHVQCYHLRARPVRKWCERAVHRLGVQYSRARDQATGAGGTTSTGEHVHPLLELQHGEPLHTGIVYSNPDNTMATCWELHGYRQPVFGLVTAPRFAVGHILHRHRWLQQAGCTMDFVQTGTTPVNPTLSGTVEVTSVRHGLQRSPTVSALMRLHGRRHVQQHRVDHEHRDGERGGAGGCTFTTGSDPTAPEPANSVSAKQAIDQYNGDAVLNNTGGIRFGNASGLCNLSGRAITRSGKRRFLRRPVLLKGFHQRQHLQNPTLTGTGHPPPAPRYLFDGALTVVSLAALSAMDGGTHNSTVDLDHHVHHRFHVCRRLHLRLGTLTLTSAGAGELQSRHGHRPHKSATSR